LRSSSALPMNRPRAVRVVKVVDEAKDTRTLIFEDELLSKAEPGQFAMVWVPGVKEMPMSISYMRGRLAGVTVKRVGKGSSALYDRGVGSLIGVRGPYGKGFRPVRKKALLVGGGVGLAPLLPLAERLMEFGRPMLVAGAKSREGIPFFDRARRLLGDKVVFVTEDGSFGEKGLASDVAGRLMDGFEVVYTCGPEAMMRKLYELAKEKGLEIQASLERFMRCGFGLCGSCVIGPFLVCKDGPVFDKGMLEAVEGEFGSYSRDRCGRRIPI